MALSRFYICAVNGNRAMSKRAAEGVALHVLDRPYAHRVVATFASEDRLPDWGGNRRGVEGAKMAALAKCEELNKWDKS